VRLRGSVGNFLPAGKRNSEKRIRNSRKRKNCAKRKGQRENSLAKRDRIAVKTVVVSVMYKALETREKAITKRSQISSKKEEKKKGLSQSGKFKNKRRGGMRRELRRDRLVVESESGESQEII